MSVKRERAPSHADQSCATRHDWQLASRSYTPICTRQKPLNLHRDPASVEYRTRCAGYTHTAGARSSSGSVNLCAGDVIMHASNVGNRFLKLREPPVLVPPPSYLPKFAPQLSEFVGRSSLPVTVSLALV